MVSDRGTWRDGDPVQEPEPWPDIDVGPPSQLDLDWYVHHVVALGYPRGWKDPIINGQLDIITYLANEEWDSDRDG